jgi:hypothetical protein
VILADEFIQIAGPHSRGERLTFGHIGDCPTATELPLGDL